MNDSITSVANERVKKLVKLRESAKKRKQEKLFVVEGNIDLNLIMECGRVVDEIYYCKELVEKNLLTNDLKKFKSLGIPIIELGHASFCKASYRKSSDGFLSTVKMWSNSLEDIQDDLGDICVVLDETEKPGNLGAIIRSVEAMGVKTLLLCDLQVDFFNPNVIRSSRGLLAGVNVWQGSKEEIFTLLTAQKFSLIGTSGKAEKSYWNHKFKNKTALIFGSEKDGLGEFWLNNVDDLIKIPMNGNADSLNLNASVACILAEYQRKKLDGSSKRSQPINAVVK